MPKRNHLDDKDSSDGDEPSIVNIDFDFFDPAPIDFIAIKRLLSQLFQADAELLHTHELTELIVSQPLVGTTVKTDGIDSDPYAFLTVLNMNANMSNVAINAIVEYLLTKSAQMPAFQDFLKALFAPSSKHQVGLILSERLINMPVQIAPHMYRLLSDEIRWALDENEPYNFTHYLCISRTFEMSVDNEPLPHNAPPPSKKLKGQPTSQLDDLKQAYPYHQEDDIWESLSVYTINYEFTRQPTREPGAIGAAVAAKAMLMPAARFPEMISAMSQQFSVM